MTDDNSNLVDMDNLDAFEDAFFNRKPVATDDPEDKVEDEDVPETEDDALATEEDTDASEDEPTEDEDPDDEPEPKPEPKKGKKSFQDRIDELTRGKREAERREAELLKRLEAHEVRKSEENTTAEPKPLREQLPAEAPSPDATDENGEPIYPLGEFDPAFIRDLTKFTIAQETKAAKEAEETARQQSMFEAAQEELKSSWLEKVDAATEELPDIRERLATMGEAFDGIDPNYGEFLAATIMSCDYGPQIMYYLSQNIGEAQKIVASGPASATLAIGRLDARFTKAPEQKRNTKKVSGAPKPPAAMSRGSGGRFAVPGDTDDLDAFEKEFFKRK
jgi:hypothetical protein